MRCDPPHPPLRKDPSLQLVVPVGPRPAADSWHSRLRFDRKRHATTIKIAVGPRPSINLTARRGRTRSHLQPLHVCDVQLPIEIDKRHVALRQGRRGCRRDIPFSGWGSLPAKHLTVPFQQAKTQGWHGLGRLVACALAVGTEPGTGGRGAKRRNATLFPSCRGLTMLLACMMLSSYANSTTSSISILVGPLASGGL